MEKVRENAGRIVSARGLVDLSRMEVKGIQGMIRGPNRNELAMT